MNVNGEVRADTIGENPAGDPMRLLLWLANEGARSADGLRAGCVVTTGSLTGVIVVLPPVNVRAELNRATSSTRAFWMRWGLRGF